jgi:hypothetical protein
MTSFRGFAAVSLFLATILIANGSLAPSTIDASHGTVYAGTDLTVKVHAAQCHPVEVVLKLSNGDEIRGTIPEVPGDCTLKVPENSGGMQFTLEVICPNDRVASSGVVS